METPRLMLLPTRDSYSLTFGDDVMRTQYTKGMPRTRLDSVGSPHVTPISFINKGVMHDYLLRFYRSCRAKAFKLRLYADSTSLDWYICKFNSVPVQKSLGGGVFEWSCSVAVYPTPLNDDLDNMFVVGYDASDGDFMAFVNWMAKVVNVTIPEILGGADARL